MSTYNLATKWVRMFYRRAWGYIIAYKLTSHTQTLADLDIELLAYISVERIENMVKDFKSHICAFDFDSLLFRLVVKER